MIYSAIRFGKTLVIMNSMVSSSIFILFFPSIRFKDTLQVVCGVLKMSQTKDWNRFEIDDIVEHEYSR